MTFWTYLFVGNGNNVIPPYAKYAAFNYHDVHCMLHRQFFVFKKEIQALSWDTGYQLGYRAPVGIQALSWDTGHQLGYMLSVGIQGTSWDTDSELGLGYQLYNIVRAHKYCMVL